jgi:hypothetical protein
MDTFDKRNESCKISRYCTFKVVLILHDSADHVVLEIKYLSKRILSGITICKHNCNPFIYFLEEGLEHKSKKRPGLPNGKKTKGRVKIKMEFIDNKLRRYTTFSKRKTGIMKKAYELSTLTGEPT